MADTKSMNLMDASLLAMETAETPLHLGGAFILRLPGGADDNFVRDLVERWRRWPVNRPPFMFRLAKSRLPMLAPRWERLREIDLDQHFFHVALPHPAGDRELEALVAQLHSIPLDRGRPLWQIHVVEGLSDRRFAIYAKVHHALADGITAMRLFTEQYSETPRAANTRPVWTLPHKRVVKATGPKRKASGPAAWPSVVVGDALQLVRQTVEGVSKAAAVVSDFDLARRMTIPAPDTIFNRPITARRELGSVTFDFQRLRAVSKRLGCTINDVALAMTGGALRRYLDDLDELPATSVVATVPVSLNKAGNPEGGNTVTSIPVPLGTNIQGARKRLESIQATMNGIKAELQRTAPETIHLLTAAIEVPVALEQITGRWIAPQRFCNLILSNVPGPQRPMYLSDAEVVGAILVPMVMRGMALNITVISMLDRIWFNYIACPDAVPEVRRLGPFLVRSFEELEASVHKPLRRKASRGRPRGTRARSRAAG